MKTKTVNLYNASELKELNPMAFEKAHKKYCEQEYNFGLFWQNEIEESFKAIFKASGVVLKDWSLNPEFPNQSYVKIEFDCWNGCNHSEWTEDLQGQRAIAWLENNLFADLRIPYTGSKRWDLSKYGRYYRAGMIKPCPFTGYYLDDVLIESLVDSINNGNTLREAYENIALVVAKEMKKEWEYQLSEEAFIDHADANGYFYTEDGKRFE